MAFTLTPQQRAQFDLTGLLRLSGFFNRSDIDRMADALWDDLEVRFGVRRDDPQTWTVRRPSAFQPLIARGAFDALATPELAALADQVIGAGAWEQPRRWGQPLVTFPAAAWDMPRVMWHFDVPAPNYPWPFSNLRLFTFLEPVRPHGGGTLVVSGSHRLALDVAPDAPVSSARLRGRLKVRHRWIADLCATPGDAVRRLVGVPARIDGHDVAVEEMTGEPGDLVLMHPLTLHGLSHNALDRPRMMLVQSLFATPLSRPPPRGLTGANEGE